MLRDIAKGLAYLHPQVIHRDLSAKNILLTPFFTAKICDFGSALSSDSNSRPHELTPYPGERVYMPPEALADPAMYDCSMDIFSFGHLALFTMIQVPLC
jgi:serine/threonine protein kinase